VASAYDAAQWADFGVAVVGATAALTGLLFVAVSINLERILRFDTLPRLAATTLMLFGSALFAGILVLVPGQSHRALGTELLLLGIATALATLPRLVTESPYEGTSWWSWLLSRPFTAGLTALSLVLAGAGYSFQGLGGLYWLVVAVLAAVFGGLVNAWVLLVEILR
jgi:modulator of FtsH protease